MRHHAGRDRALRAALRARGGHHLHRAHPHRAADGGGRGQALASSYAASTGPSLDPYIAIYQYIIIKKLWLLIFLASAYAAGTGTSSVKCRSLCVHPYIHVNVFVHVCMYMYVCVYI